MGKIIEDKIHTDIEHTNSSEDRLTIVINSNDIDYCHSNSGIIAKVDSKPVDLELTSVSEVLTTLSDEFPNVKDVRIFLNNSSYTFVPAELYEKTDQRAYMRNVIDLDTTEKLVVQNDLIKNRNLVCIYTYSKELEKEIHSVFPESIISHQNSCLDSVAMPIEKSYVYASIHKKSVTLMAFKEGKFVLNNTYQIQNEEELLYYILLLYDQLELNVNSTPIFASKEIGEKSAAFDLLKEYIQNVTITEIPKDKMSASLKSIDSTKYFDLYISSQCEL